MRRNIFINGVRRVDGVSPFVNRIIISDDEEVRNEFGVRSGTIKQDQKRFIRLKSRRNPLYKLLKTRRDFNSM